MKMKNTDILELVRLKFPDISERALQEEISEVGEIHRFQGGDTIMNYGSYVKMVPLVVEGSIKVSREDDRDGREILLYFLSAGDTCSMSFSCCMTHKKSAIRTEAEEDTTVIGIPIKYVDSWITKYPSWKNFVMSSYDNRMFELVKVIDNIAFKDLDGRMQTYLEALSDSLASKVLGRTHQEIAGDLNVSREAVSRLLKKMEKQGMVELGRNRIVILW